MKKNKENVENERQIYVNVVHPNGLVDTFYMGESAIKKKYGDVEIDENDCVIINIEG